MPYTTYAIGDIHGRAELLETLLDAVAEHADARGTEPRVLFLGDIVDRGGIEPNGNNSCPATRLIGGLFQGSSAATTMTIC